MIICLHDTSLARTTDANQNIKELNVRDLSFKQIKYLDAGKHFDKKYTGESIPTLDQVFNLMARKSDRLLYLDVKDADLDILKEKITNRDLEHRIIFVHGEREMLKKLKKTFPKSKTMTWLGGDKSEIIAKYDLYKTTKFDGIDQLQFHLKAKPDFAGIDYEIDDAYLRKVKLDLELFNVQMQVRPFAFNPISMKNLINLGITWYVTDAPKDFYECLQNAVKMDDRL